MSQSPTTHTLPALPITVTVDVMGGVLIDAGARVIAMSRFSNRAQRLALDFGAGAHVIATEDDIADLSDLAVYDIAEALA